MRWTPAMLELLPDCHHCRSLEKDKKAIQQPRFIQRVDAIHRTSSVQRLRNCRIVAFRKRQSNCSAKCSGFRLVFAAVSASSLSFRPGVPLLCSDILANRCHLVNVPNCCLIATPYAFP